MKGKATYSAQEIEQLKALISKRTFSNDKTEKKALRDEMRAIGFWGRDDWGIYDCKIEDLENLIKEGKIAVV